MGTRDKQGREKKKPKKKEIKQLNRPTRLATDYKPAEPPQSRQSDDAT